MTKNVYVLSDRRDSRFLKQGRVEGFTGCPLAAGDSIVVCSKCKRVWLQESWELNKRCPDKDCKESKTVPFRAGDFKVRRSGTGRIRISDNSSPWERFLFEAGSAMDKTLLKMIAFIRPALDTWMVVLPIAAIALSLYQFNTEESVINGRNKIYYQTAVKEAADRAVKSVTANGEQAWLSLKDAVAGKAAVSIADAFRETVGALADDIDKTKFAMAEDVSKTTDALSDDVDKTTDALSEDVSKTKAALTEDVSKTKTALSEDISKTGAALSDDLYKTKDALEDKIRQWMP